MLQTCIVALLPSSLMISPIKLSKPTRISSYIAAPAMLSATTTGPETRRTKLRARKFATDYGLGEQAALFRR